MHTILIMESIKNNYAQFVEEYMAVFEPLFEKAHEVSEFNLIMSLLAIRGVSDDGWNPYENTEDVFEEVYKQQGKFRGSLGFNINLWMYLHLIECSEHYEIIANLINTIKGDDYIVANHKNKLFANLKVEQKIDRLKSIAKNTDFENVVDPFINTFNGRFRNAIGHADYAIKSTEKAGVTIADDAGYPIILGLQEVNDLINRAVALHVAIRSLIKHYRTLYKRSDKIKSSVAFGRGIPIDVTLIVRKDYGVIGFRCIGGYDFGTPFENRPSVCLPYERSLIDSGVNDLPSSKVDKINNILKFVPKKLAPSVAKKLKRLYGIDVN
jgi:hypothetical protein